jgi:hypothetical protein
MSEKSEEIPELYNRGDIAVQSKFIKGFPYAWHFPKN